MDIKIENINEDVPYIKEEVISLDNSDCAELGETQLNESGLNQVASNSYGYIHSIYSLDVNEFPNDTPCGVSIADTCSDPMIPLETIETPRSVLIAHRKSKLRSGLASVPPDDKTALLKYLDSADRKSNEATYIHHGYNTDKTWCAWCLVEVTDFKAHLSLHGRKREVKSVLALADGTEKRLKLKRMKLKHLLTVTGSWVMTYYKGVSPCHECSMMVNDSELRHHFNQHFNVEYEDEPIEYQNKYKKFLSQCDKLKSSLNNQFILNLGKNGVSGLVVEVASNLIKHDNNILLFGKYLSGSKLCIDSSAYGKMIECATTLFACSQINAKITDMTTLLSVDHVSLLIKVLKTFERINLNSSRISKTIYEFSEFIRAARFDKVVFRIGVKKRVAEWQKAFNECYIETKCIHPNFWYIDVSLSDKIHNQFIDYIDATIGDMTQWLVKRFSEVNWDKLGDALLCRLMFLNKKVCVSEITLHYLQFNYDAFKRLRNSIEPDVLQEIGEGARSIQILKKLYVYIPAELKRAVKVYKSEKNRKKAKVHPDNKFLFAEGDDHMSALYALDRCWTRFNTDTIQHYAKASTSNLNSSTSSAANPTSERNLLFPSNNTKRWV